MELSLKKAGGAPKGRLPSKNTINFAKVGEKKLNMLIAIPAIILIVVIAAILSKVLVVDRFAEVSAAQAEVAHLQRQIDKGYKRMDELGEFTEVYAHYTYSDMTFEELERSDRIAIMDVLKRVVLPQVTLKSWSVTGNQMVLSVKGESLEQINQISKELMNELIVDYTALANAKTITEYGIETGYVEATINVKLLTASEAEAAAQAAEQAATEEAATEEGEN